MRHSTTAPHVLLIEPTPVYALLSSAELDAAGFEVTLAGSLQDGQRWAEVLLDPRQPASPTLVLINLALGSTLADPLPGLRLARLLRQQISQGLLRQATIVGLIEQPSRAAVNAALAAGCDLLRSPLRPSAAHLMRRVTSAAPLEQWPAAEHLPLHTPHAA